MTQTASIQCAFDYSDPRDWQRKFRAAAVLSPVATALFANSSRVDGADSGWASFRRRIWSETDPARCGLPPGTFDPGFDVEAWLDWVLDVPTMFVHRARGRVPAGGGRFRTCRTHELPQDQAAHSYEPRGASAAVSFLDCAKKPHASAWRLIGGVSQRTWRSLNARPA